MKHTYHLHVLHNEQWVELFGEETLNGGLGYLRCHREAPGPRLPMALVRDDGRVMDSSPGLEGASLGMVAGWPPPEQYVRAATTVLRKARCERSGRQYGTPEGLAAAIRDCEQALDELRAGLAP
jgi:hypothetical protein